LSARAYVACARKPALQSRGTGHDALQPALDSVPTLSTFWAEISMLHYAVIFFIIALIAAVFGFAGIAAGAAGIAKILFFVFLILAVVSFIANTARR
jgi:uncharacterized membrane protein YtjA (UPF0391 family)